MRRMMTMAGLLVVASAVAFAQGGPGGGMGGGMMGGGMMAGGSGMLVVADDGSLLVTEMDVGGGHMGGGALQRELVCLGPDGQERWRASFDDGWPMMPATDGDLVVLALADSSWMGYGGTGDGGWHGGGKLLDGDDVPATLVALSLATGAEQWRLELDGDMISLPQFAPDGSRIYVTVRSMDHHGPLGNGPLHQGDAGDWSMAMSSSVVAISRDGQQLWSVDLGDGGMGGPMGGGGH